MTKVESPFDEATTSPALDQQIVSRLGLFVPLAMTAATASATLDTSPERLADFLSNRPPYVEAPMSEVERDELMHRWDSSHELDAVEVVNRFVERLVSQSRLPNPEAAVILEENFWDLV